MRTEGSTAPTGFLDANRQPLRAQRHNTGSRGDITGAVRARCHGALLTTVL
jgi:hypothetical protein